MEVNSNPCILIEDAGCFCFYLDSGLTRALPKERAKECCVLFFDAAVICSHVRYN